MNIQVLTQRTCFLRDKNFCISKISEPRSFDEFDYNIVDFNDGQLWKFDKNKSICLDIKGFARLLSKILQETKKSNTLIIMPQNITTGEIGGDGWTISTYNIKISSIIQYFPDSLSPMIRNFPTIRYEKSVTKIDDDIFLSDFVFDESIYRSLKKSNGGKDVILDIEGIYVTTLDIKDNNEVGVMLDFILSQYHKSIAPEWISNIEYFSNRSYLSEKDEVLKQLDVLEKEISKNNKIKSILYSTGDELVGVVKEILVDIFKLTDSHFTDVKKEDFRFEFEDVNFMVEIKGINTNIKNSNIAQCKKHVADLIAEDDTKSPGNVKGLLIVNPQRDIEPGKREPIHANQISYAKSEGILIITTLELLKLYQAYTKDEVVSNKCFETFKNNVGEFKFDL
ncbi:MAG: hypothetical protein Q3967_01405 [Campylobacter sp.]|uniref:hypothetical protein n=1 Tax=Campylobacter concisus TaxID=199 RepID=UPI0011E881FE|nr:hypothetical protein [Campylobacter concisus]MDO4874723.1 hypothetical protein [Campylobacter sp.]